MRSIEQILKTYNPTTIGETKSILRELIQSIVLVGLSRGGFFNKASFYGGTALRIFHGLNRYSEDLDFTLNEADSDFSIEDYIPGIIEVAKSYGLDLEITTKTKKKETPIESAFAKLNTYQTFINLKMNDTMTNLLQKDEVLKVKFEVDCNPPLGFVTQSKWIDIPEFATVSVLDEESLFAGKIHAILCRNYKNTVKGRDYYDYLFYISKRIKPNLAYLKNKLVESKKIDKGSKFDMDILKQMLKERFSNVDFKQVKDDVQRFIINGEDISYYSKELFIQMTDKL